MDFTLHKKLIPDLASILLASLLILLVPQAFATPALVTTIKPLQLIAAAITADLMEPQLILAAGQDPHEMVLRPSDRRLLSSAGLVLWIGPALELPIASLVQDLPSRVLTVQTLPGIVLYGLGETIDPHMWLSLENAGTIARALAQALGSLDPERSDAYFSNLQHFETALQKLQVQTAGQLSGKPVLSWAVYHHAFQYIEQEQTLPIPLALTDSNNTLPGIRGLLEIRQEFKSRALNCLLAEPGTDWTKVHNMLDMPELSIIEADILGLAQPVNASGYIQLYTGILNAISACSKGGQDD